MHRLPMGRDMNSSLSRIRSTLALLLGLAGLFTPGLAAQEHAPLPESLTTARTIHLINDSGDLKAYDVFFKELSKWGRFGVVQSREAADLVAVLTSSATYSLTIGTATAATTAGVTTSRQRDFRAQHISTSQDLRGKDSRAGMVGFNREVDRQRPCPVKACREPEEARSQGQVRSFGHVSERLLVSAGRSTSLVATRSPVTTLPRAAAEC